MPRILISAFSCCPGHGSEPGVGWNTVVQLAAEPANELWVLVEHSMIECILTHVAEHPMPNVNFISVGSPLLSRWMCKVFTQSISWNAYYYLWQFALIRPMRRLHDEHRFDVTQHVTYVKFSVPSLLPLLEVPFIWGPVGGAESVPMAFFKGMDRRSRLHEAARLLFHHISVFNPLLRWTARRSTIAFGTTEQTAATLRKLGAKNTQVLPAVALSTDEFSALTQPGQRTPVSPDLTLVFVGNLIAVKGVHFAIQALARSGCTHVRLRIIGDGALRPWLEQIAREAGLAERIEFLGRMQREEVFREYCKADGFLFASLHDSGGYAVLEAMAAGLPVICLDLGGPGHIVDEDSGWKATAPNPEAAVENLAAAIRAFASSSAERDRRAAGAHQRVANHFTWKTHGGKLRAVIGSVTKKLASE